MATGTGSTAAGMRDLTEGDLAAAHGLSQAVGWAHRLEDWRFVHRLGRGFAGRRSGLGSGRSGGRTGGRQQSDQDQQTNYLGHYLGHAAHGRFLLGL